MTTRDLEILSTDQAEAAALKGKLIDSELPGTALDFDPEEADRAGAFEEDAVRLADALDSAHD
jgi:hypothetical protein